MNEKHIIDNSTIQFIDIRILALTNFWNTTSFITGFQYISLQNIAVIFKRCLIHWP